jgi:hypothetical protein
MQLYTLRNGYWMHRVYKELSCNSHLTLSSDDSNILLHCFDNFLLLDSHNFFELHSLDTEIIHIYICIA